MGTKYDSLYRLDSDKGKEAWEILKNLQEGDQLYCYLMDSLDEKVRWVLVSRTKEKNTEDWTLNGYFCTIPFYSLHIQVQEGKIGLVVKELP